MNPYPQSELYQSDLWHEEIKIPNMIANITSTKYETHTSYIRWFFSRPSILPYALPAPADEEIDDPNKQEFRPTKRWKLSE